MEKARTMTYKIFENIFSMQAPSKFQASVCWDIVTAA